MSATILSGKPIAEKINKSTQDIIQNRKLKVGLASILVGDHQPSQTYIRIKETTAKKVGITFTKKSFPTSFPPIKIIDAIKEFNADQQINGIIVQLPLPPDFIEEQIIKAINPFKDVDVLHPKNLGQLVYNQSNLLSPIILATLQILKETNLFSVINYKTPLNTYEIPDLAGVSISIIGYGILVGKPLSIFLSNQRAIVNVINSSENNIGKYTRESKIIITATNGTNVLEPEDISEGSTLIDIGNDIITEKFLDKNIYFCKNPGGIGPLTVANLLHNTLLVAQHESLRQTTHK